MKDFKKTAGASLAFATIYTFCMYQNSASITFPILMAAGIWFLYALHQERKFPDNFISWFYVTTIMLISVSVFMTADTKLILMSKIMVGILYIGLAIELYMDCSLWPDMIYIKKVVLFPIISFIKGFDFLNDYTTCKNEEPEDPGNPAKDTIKKVLKGLIIVVPLMCIILPLMMSADIVFADMMEKFLFEEIFINLFVKMDVIGVGLTFLCALVTFYGFMKLLSHKEKETVTVHYSNEHITGITVTAAVAMVYVLFSFVQIRGILVSDIALPVGYTYAEYAREGFFQLFVLAVINMVIVMVCASKYTYNKALNIMLYLLCGCTYVMIFASAYKMILYIEVYNLTFLRLMVLWALLVLTFVMVAVIRYVQKNDFSLLKYIIIVTTFFYAIIAFGRPDYIVAQYNLEWGNEQQIDTSYLRGLSADAVPVLAGHEKLIGVSYFERMYKRCRWESLRKMNLSKVIAAECLKEYAPCE